MRTVNDVLAEIAAAGHGRTRYVGQEPRADELLAAEITRLRAALEEERADKARLREMQAALEDMLAGWRYIRAHHGDLSGVGWDRAQSAAEAALASASPAAQREEG